MIRISSVVALTLTLGLIPMLASAQLTIGSKSGWGGTLYGFARLDIIYNDARFDHAQFPNFVQPLAAGEEKRDELSLHPRLTRFGVDAWAKRLASIVDVGVKIEIDFQNGGSESREAVRMRHGYATLEVKGFTLLAGQTWQTVSRLYPSVNSDSLMWNAGNTGDRSPQVRASYRLPLGKGGLDFELAGLMPNTVDKKDVDGNGTVDGQEAAVPYAQARIAFDSPIWTKRPLKVAVGGHFGKEEARFDDGEDKDFTTWGVFCELDLPIWKGIGVKGEWFLGQNLSDLRGGIKQGVNATRREEVGTMGFWAEIYANPLTWMGLAVGFGQDDPKDGDLEKGDRALNRALWGTVWFRPVKPFRIQLEYIRWATELVDGDADEANRFNLHFSAFF